MRTKSTARHNSTSKRAQGSRKMEKRCVPSVTCCLSASKNIVDCRKRNPGAAKNAMENKCSQLINVTKLESKAASADSKQCLASRSLGKQSNASSCGSHRSKSGGRKRRLQEKPVDSESDRVCSVLSKRSTIPDVCPGAFKNDKLCESVKSSSAVMLTHGDPPVCPTCGQFISQKPTLLCPTCLICPQCRQHNGQRNKSPRPLRPKPKKKLKHVKRKAGKRKAVKHVPNKPSCYTPRCCGCMCQRACCGTCTP